MSLAVSSAGNNTVEGVGSGNFPRRTLMAISSSAIGQSLLNRYVYCVDPELKQMILIERVKGSATKPATDPK